MATWTSSIVRFRATILLWRNDIPKISNNLALIDFPDWKALSDRLNRLIPIVRHYIKPRHDKSASQINLARLIVFSD